MRVPPASCVESYLWQSRTYVHPKWKELWSIWSPWYCDDNQLEPKHALPAYYALEPRLHAKTLRGPAPYPRPSYLIPSTPPRVPAAEAIKYCTYNLHHIDFKEWLTRCREVWRRIRELWCGWELGRGIASEFVLEHGSGAYLVSFSSLQQQRFAYTLMLVNRRNWEQRSNLPEPADAHVNSTPSGRVAIRMTSNTHIGAFGTIWTHQR